MRRREFSQAVAATGVALGWASPAVMAQPRAFKEGTDYLKLSRPAPVDAPAGKVEVVEFFWYSCPHCAKFEPTFDAWAKKVPAHVAVRRVPVAFRDDNVPQQRLFYALEAMGRLDDLHARVFVAIHGQKQRLNTQEEIATWVAAQGVDKAKFLEYYNAFGVGGKVQRARQLTEAYQIDGVPAMGVAGRYFTSGSIAQSMERVLAVVEHLVEVSRKG
jgi:thiol:disulfide interchange protein DsbA